MPQAWKRASVLAAAVAVTWALAPVSANAERPSVSFNHGKSYGQGGSHAPKGGGGDRRPTTYGQDRGRSYGHDGGKSYGGDRGKDYGHDRGRDYGRDSGHDRDKWHGHDRGKDYGKHYDHRDYGHKDYGRNHYSSHDHGHKHYAGCGHHGYYRPPVRYYYPYPVVPYGYHPAGYYCGHCHFQAPSFAVFHTHISHVHHMGWNDVAAQIFWSSDRGLFVWGAFDF